MNQMLYTPSETRDERASRVLSSETWAKSCVKDIENEIRYSEPSETELDCLERQLENAIFELECIEEEIQTL